MDTSASKAEGHAGYLPKMSARIKMSMRPRASLLLVLPLIFYLAFPTRNFYWDGVSFAINIESQTPTAQLLHPSHLIYSLVGAWIYQLNEVVGLDGRALFILQAVNGVLAGLCVLLFYKCLRLRNVPGNLSVPAALIFGFSATWWKFAADANAYVPSIFFLLCADFIIESRKSVALAGLFHASALLFHELALLFLPVALLRLTSRRLMFNYCATAIAPVAVAYVLAHAVVVNDYSIRGLVSWALSHSPDSGFFFNPLTDAGLSTRGTLRLFFGGKLGDFVGDGVSNAVFAALVVATALFFVNLWSTARRGATFVRPPLHHLVWVGVYFTFLFVWMPQNTFYRLFYLPPLVAGLAMALIPAAPAVRTTAWLLVPVLFGWNFCFVTYPQSRPEFNGSLHFALAQKEAWPPGTPIVYYDFHPDLWTISYFSPQAAWIGIDRADIGELERHLEYARSQRSPLWLEAAAYNMIASNPGGQSWLVEHERPGELLEFKDEKRQLRFHSVR